MGDMRETLKEVEGCIDQLNSIKEQLRDFVLEPLDCTMDKLTIKDDSLEAMVTTLKEEIVELKVELTI